MSLDEALELDGDNTDAILAALEAEDMAVDDSEQDEAETESEIDDIESDSGDEPVAAAEEFDDDASDDEAEAQGGASDPAADEEKPVVKAKDGVHEIPYEVHASLRDENKELKKQLAELQKQSRVDAQKIEHAKANMERQGVDVEAAFSDPDNITEAEVKQYEEDYGPNDPMTKAVRRAFKAQQAEQETAQQAEAVQEQQESVQQRLTAEQQAEVDATVLANESLAKWQKDDPERWAQACQIDEQLRSDAKWMDKPLSERFAEAERRTKAFFGDPIAPPDPAAARQAAKDAAKAKVKSASKDTPDSLSDLGQSPVREKTKSEILDGLTPEGQMAEMAGMSNAELIALLD